MTSPAGTARAAATGGATATEKATGTATETATATGTPEPGPRAAAGPWLLGVRHHGPGSARAVLALSLIHISERAGK
ncbi:hypothetical protein, partial [Streptomyces sp. rh34]|uniref:hypothetical protein n=1 Tax=Streptomyces sp. rh34 TaxID=2034272 RepID=UPI00117E11CA